LPRRMVVVGGVVGYVEPSTHAYVDRVDFAVGSCPVGVGDLLAVGRIHGILAGPIVVCDFELAPSAYVDRVDLLIVSVQTYIRDSLAIRRVGREVA
jgi:hypothetical protein